jgi:hypothetical protein
MLQKTSLTVCLVLFASVPVAQAKKELTPQQQLMGACNKQASGKMGEERKSLMSTCLADGKKRQQEKMKACAVANKDMKGAEFKRAQAECLKK